MEHHEDGSANPDGKALRSKAKGITLATMYGMGAKLLSTQLNTTVEDARNILDEFFKMFPDIKKFTVDNEQLAKQQGYVEDYLGRRRHLPDAQLDEVKILATKDCYTDCDIFLDANQQDSKITISDSETNKEYLDIFNSQYKGKGFDAKTKFKDFAKNNGVAVQDNGAFISKALTQCTNARIQGSSATLTKKAMILIDNDKELNELGFRLMIPVHDELLGECLKENAERVEQRLSELMIAAAKPECSVDMKVDTYAVKHWYADEVMNSLKDNYDKLLKKGLSSEEIFKETSLEYPELGINTIRQMCLGEFDLINGDISC